jgi:hypothetical protein
MSSPTELLLHDNGIFQYPRLIGGQKVYVDFRVFGLLGSGIPEQADEAFEWCRQSLGDPLGMLRAGESDKGRWYYTGNAFFFMHEEDAARFKSRWDGCFPRGATEPAGAVPLDDPATAAVYEAVREFLPPQTSPTLVKAAINQALSQITRQEPTP